jgi:hypothetical protein
VRDLVNYAMTNNLLRKLCYEPRLKHNTPGVILVKGGQVGLLCRSHRHTTVRLPGVICHTPFFLGTENRLPYTIQVLNKDNEWDDVYNDKHTTLVTRGFNVPPEVTNLVQMLAVLRLRIELFVACVRECRDATKEDT